MFNRIGFLCRLSIPTVLLLLSSPGSIMAQQASCNNVMHGAVVIDYSSSYGDDFAPENLIDGDQNRSWSASESDEAPYLVLDLGDTFEITSMQLNGYYQANDPAYQGDSVREFRLDALVNDQWATVIEGESPLADRLTAYRFPAPVVTNQVKISFLSNHGGTAFEAAELVVCGQRATAQSNTGGGGKQAGGKENPENEPILFIQGNLAENGEDTWTFEGNQNQIVTVELQGNTYGAYVGLHEPDGDRLGYDTADDDYVDHTYYAGIFGNRLLTDGTYTVVVRNTIGPYTLQVYEGYFGQTVGTAAPGQSVQGNLAEKGFNRWLIELSAGQIISIELQGNTYGAYVALHQPDGNRLDYDTADENYINDSLYAGKFGIRILTDGLYMIRVANQIGPYTLTVNEGYFGQSVGTVTPGQTVQGNLAENGFDRWLVTLSQGQTIRIRLQANTYGAYVGLYDPDGDRVGYDTANDASGSGYRADLEYRVLITGLYMVRASNLIGDYTLTVSAP